MITVGCAGFPIPATRYFKEFTFVEVDGFVPGSGTVRRCRREAPAGFVFSIVAPKTLGAEGFRTGAVTDAALAETVQLVADLNGAIVLFAAPEDFAPTKANKSAAKETLGLAKSRLPAAVDLVWQAAHWPAEEALRFASESGAMVVRDPLTQGLATGAEAVYYKLAGPAGHKSRYEDPALAELTELALGAKHTRAYYVFSNVDMAQDAKRLLKGIGAA